MTVEEQRRLIRRELCWFRFEIDEGRYPHTGSCTSDADEDCVTGRCRVHCDDPECPVHHEVGGGLFR
jgi:hypothetical protein